MAYSLLHILCSLSVIYHARGQQQWFQAKHLHQPKLLSGNEVSHIASLSNMQGFHATLDPILVPRVVGTENHAKVRHFIMDQMRTLGWDVETDKFKDRTPFGDKNFENIIATLDPKADRRLVLACHYDSKYSREGTFVGATDSAVPCAMMITLARDLSRQLDDFKSGGKSLTLQFIFFDGEEAFRNWNSRDSIYGARNLAKKWSSRKYPEGSNNRDGTTFLHRMDLLVLLDLLGTRNPSIASYISSGDRWFNHIAGVEQRLRRANLLKTRGPNFFRNDFAAGGIEDDHIPFMQRGVPILHVIPTPFPDVWHTDRDNKAALDYDTIDDLNKILRVFVIEYLNIEA